MKFIIRKSSKSATQSGFRKSSSWVLVPDITKHSYKEDLMGWISSINTKKQSILSFISLDEAINYAKSNNLEFEIKKPRKIKKEFRSYSENFN